MTADVTIDFSRPMPVFPLTDCVHLPHAFLPLHIFEPRYRTMINETLDRSGLIAMALYDGHPEMEEPSLQGPAPIRPCVCLGQLCQYETLTDGRLVVILEGLCRAQAISEVPHQPYRMFRMRPLPSRRHNVETLAQRIHDMIGLLEGPELSRLESATKLITMIRSGDHPHAELVDLAIASFCTDTEQRYAMLAESSPTARAIWITRHIELLSGRTSNRRPARRPGTSD